MLHTSGKEELAPPDKEVHSLFAKLQEKTAFLPDYGFKEATSESPAKEEAWPTVNAGKSVAGILGVAITLAVAALIGIGLQKFRKER
jgi:cobalt/nickel transport system permease protein